MRKGLNLWAFPNGMRFEDMLMKAKDAGFDDVELNLDQNGYLGLTTTQSQVAELKNLAQKIGIRFASLCTGLFWKYSLTSDKEDERNQAKKIVRLMIDFASWLGIKTILIVPGAVENIFTSPIPPPIAYDIVYDRAMSALKEFVDYAEGRDVKIGVENVWNKFLLSPLEFRGFIDEIGSAHVGAYFDVGNVVAFGYPEDWIKILGKRIKQVHVKDFKKTVAYTGVAVGLLEGDINWKAVIRALKSVEYDGYLVAELWPVRFSDDWRIHQTATALDTILAA